MKNSTPLVLHLLLLVIVVLELTDGRDEVPHESSGILDALATDALEEGDHLGPRAGRVEARTRVLLEQLLEGAFGAGLAIGQVQRNS